MDPFEKPFCPVRASSHADMAGRASKGAALFSGHGEKKRIEYIHTHGKKCHLWSETLLFSILAVVSDRELLTSASLGVGSQSFKVTCRAILLAQKHVSWAWCAAAVWKRKSTTHILRHLR